MTGAPVAAVWHGPLVEVGLDSGPLNLVTKPLLRALNDVLSQIANHADTRCLILHGGTARAFCAGSDIKEFAPLRSDASEHKILFEDMVLRRLARLPMPTIAAIDGPALGGGLELALACDLRVLRQGVALGLTESRLGGLAGSGALRLTRLVGPARAKEMLFSGETVSDEQALAWGLVNRIASVGTALDAARALAEIHTRNPGSLFRRWRSGSIPPPVAPPCLPARQSPADVACRPPFGCRPAAMLVPGTHRLATVGGASVSLRQAVLRIAATSRHPRLPPHRDEACKSSPSVTLA